MSDYNYPQLRRVQARGMIEGFSGRSIHELSDSAKSGSEEAVYPAVGGVRVPTEILDELRTEVVKAARSLGFPDESDQDGRRQFDREAGVTLHQCLPIRPRVAADPDVWSYICCVLMPDVVRWRFPDSGAARYLGGARNTLQRLWLRAAVLCDRDSLSPYHLLDQLPEDSMVQIFERPAVWADWAHARLIAEQLITVRQESTQRFNFQNLVRRVLLEIRQLMPIASLSSLGPDAQREVVESVIQRALPSTNQVASSG